MSSDKFLLEISRIIEAKTPARSLYYPKRQVEYLAHQILRAINDRLPQVNYNTSVIEMQDEYYRPVQSYSAEVRGGFEKVKIKKPINRWSVKGVKTILWNIWGEFFDNAPDHNQYENHFQERSWIERVPIPKEEQYELSFQLDHYLSFEMRFVYNPMKDVVTILDLRFTGGY